MFIIIVVPSPKYRSMIRLTNRVHLCARSRSQAVVEGVQGTWRNLTSVVNMLAANLTSQVRAIAKVTKVSCFRGVRRQKLVTKC